MTMINHMEKFSVLTKKSV